MATGTNGIACGADLNSIAQDGQYFSDTTKCYTKSDILAASDDYVISGSYSDDQLVRTSDVRWQVAGITIMMGRCTLVQNGTYTTPFGNFSAFPLTLTISLGNLPDVSYSWTSNSGNANPSWSSKTISGSIVSEITGTLSGYAYIGTSYNGITSFGYTVKYSLDGSTYTTISGGGQGMQNPTSFSTNFSRTGLSLNTIDLSGISFRLEVSCNKSA